MNQLIIVTKIVGETGKALFESFLKGEEFAKIKEVIKGIRNFPPSLFYTEYADMWSMGDIFTRYVHSKKHFHHLQEGGLEIFAIEASKLALKKKELFFQFDEEEYFYTSLKQARNLFKALNNKSYIFIIRTCIGATVTDKEVKESINIDMTTNFQPSVIVKP